MSLTEVIAIGVDGDRDQLIGGLILVATSFIFFTTLLLVSARLEKQRRRRCQMIREEFGRTLNLRRPHR